MEENFPWQIVFVATLFSLLVLGIAYYFITPHGEWQNGASESEKIAEFVKTRVEGHKAGKKSWEFYARYGWTEKNQEITHLTQVKNGKIYQDSRITINNLAAPGAKIWKSTEIIEAFGSPEAKRLTALIDLSRFGADPLRQRDWTQLKAGYIKYIPAEKKSELKNNVTLIKRGMVISASAINIDHDKKIAELMAKVTVKREDGTISAAAGRYFGQNEQLDVSDGTRLALKDEKIITNINCQNATLFNDLDKDITLKGNLEVSQGKKLAVAPEGIYSKKQPGLSLRGGARAVFEKARAILKSETARQLNDPEVKTILKNKTVIKAEEIFFSTKTGDATASGNVEVTQLGREARSAAAVYDERKEQLTLTGDVFMKKGERWIKSQKVIVSVPQETFEAIGSVEARFKI